MKVNPYFGKRLIEKWGENGRGEGRERQEGEKEEWRERGKAIQTGREDVIEGGKRK